MCSVTRVALIERIGRADDEMSKRDSEFSVGKEVSAPEIG